MEKSGLAAEVENALLEQQPSLHGADDAAAAAGGCYVDDNFDVRQPLEQQIEQPKLKSDPDLNPDPDPDPDPDPTSQEQASQPPDRVDELQLATNLAVSLAPMAADEAAREDEDEDVAMQGQAQQDELGMQVQNVETDGGAELGNASASAQPAQGLAPHEPQLADDSIQRPGEYDEQHVQAPVEQPVEGYVQAPPLEDSIPGGVRASRHDDSSSMKDSNSPPVEQVQQDLHIRNSDHAAQNEGNIEEQHNITMDATRNEAAQHQMSVLQPQPQQQPQQQQQQQQQQHDHQHHQHGHQPPPQQHHHEQSLDHHSGQVMHEQVNQGQPPQQQQHQQPPPLSHPHQHMAQNMMQQPQYGNPPHQSQMTLPPHLQLYATTASPDGGLPPRKRTKVSRACDECRRKKIKCDAISETGETACSNCQRSQAQCAFSRIPQKRGPSKGYIKELAERINSIEGKLGSQQGGLSANDLLELASGAAPRRVSTEAYPASAQLNENAKRPLSSGMPPDAFASPVPGKQQPNVAGWASEPHAAYVPPTSASSSTPTRGQQQYYSVNNLAPRLAPAPAPMPPPAPPNAAAVPVTTAAPGAADGLQTGGIHEQEGGLRDIDDNVFHGYLTIIHPTFPFLASVKELVQSTLAHSCPSILQDAFLEALSSTMQSFNAMPEGVAAADASSANRMLSQWESEGSQRSYASNLVRLQTLLLLAIEAENHGPQSLNGQHGGPSKTDFLARAVAVSYELDLRNAQLYDFSGPETDSESSEKVALRAWWSLVALDRFNAAGTARPLLIPQNGIHVTSALRSLLGDAGFHFIVLCHTLGHYVETFLSRPRGLSHPETGESQHVNAAALAHSLEVWRINLSATITPNLHPVLHFAYWHCRILTYLFTPSSTSTELLWAAKGLLDDLTSNHLALSPLNHHVTCLVGVCLTHLSRVPKTRDEAVELISNELLGGNTAPSTWDVVVHEKVASADPGDPGSLASATASQGLKHLADLAAASTDLAEAGGGGGDGESRPWDDSLLDKMKYRVAANYENLGFDPRPLLQSGYLNVLRGSI